MQIAYEEREQADLRVQRTRRLIFQAFIALTIERGFGSLTVRDIAERAGINRSTFYRHYLDKYGLLEAYMAEIAALTEAAPPSVGGSAQRGPVALLRHIQQHADFYQAMLGNRCEPVFVEHFRRNTEQHLRAWLVRREEAGGAPAELWLRCLAYAGIGAIRWWLEEGRSIAPEQLAAWLDDMTVGVAGPLEKAQLSAA